MIIVSYILPALTAFYLLYSNRCGLNGSIMDSAIHTVILCLLLCVVPVVNIVASFVLIVTWMIDPDEYVFSPTTVRDVVNRCKFLEKSRG